jgi:predicted O-methyltransferase YrrM
MTTKYYYKRANYYLKKALYNPALTVNYLRLGHDRISRFQVERMARRLGLPEEEARQYYRVPALKELRDHIIRAAEGTPFVGVGQAGYDIYVLIRLLKPEVVVETGVEAGVSSSFILQALHDNNKGQLYSIDYRVPEGDLVDNVRLGLIPVEAIPMDKETGFVIPDNLRERWTFKAGKSNDLLPGLAKELGEIDVFWHDSDHSYENMVFEFDAVWDYLREGGLIIAHDTDANNAVKDFSRWVKRKPVELTFRGGFTAILK